MQTYIHEILQITDVWKPREAKQPAILAFFRLRNEAPRKINFDNGTTAASECVRKTQRALEYAAQDSC